MKAIIMAGGEGTRLRPLTCTRPKPMVPVLNRPCMEHIINLLRNHGISEIGVTLQFLPEKIQDFFGSGKRLGVRIKYFIEDVPLGTAGSVKNAESFLDETFIVISGDALTDCDLQKAVAFHKEKKALATLVLTKVTCPLEYGVVIADREGRIMRFLEKPGWGEVFSDTVNTGIYILEPELLNYIEQGKMVDFSKDLYPMLLAAGKPVYAFVTDGYWCDIGTIDQYLQAHCDLLERKAKNLFSSTEIQPGVWADSSVKIEPSVQILPPVILGKNCFLGSRARIGPFVVLGNDVWVGENASLKKTVVWERSWIGEGAELRGAVIGESVRIRNRASLYEGSVVGDRSVVGEKSTVKSCVKIWPEKWVEKGTVLHSSLVWGKYACPRIFGARGISGDVNTDINPEFASRLGISVGSAFDLPARFSISTDGHSSTYMVKSALLAGLMSTGIQVFDLGNLIVPVHRYGIRSLRLNGGIHIYRAGKNRVNIRLLNDKGIDYSRAEQRKIEGIMNREEYRFVTSENIFSMEYVPDINSAYLNYLLSFMDKSITRKARIKVVVDYDQERVGSLLLPLLDGLGCEVVTFATSRKLPQTIGEMLRTAEQFGEIVREQGAHFGAVFDSGGEDVVIVDELGRIVHEDLFTALLSLIILSSNERATIVLPVTAPESLDELVRRKGGKIKRTQTNHYHIMQNMLNEEIVSTQTRYPQFLIYGDALITVAVIAEFLASKNKLLSEILSEIPVFATSRKEVEVAWEDKGKVLRFLAEDSTGRDVEMTEGIKMYHPKGWALVLPDSDEPVCWIYSEGFNQEIADSLAEIYENKIQQICQYQGDS